jgi:4-methyl-5(b-hydroxyethyl)-thiazole monophosphate biosynthesis
MNKPTALIAVADGTEDLEFAGPVDVLGLAGFEIFVVSVMPENRLTCKTGRGISIKADYHITDDNIIAQDFDVIIVPGGIPGAANCAASDPLIEKLKHQKTRGGWYSAICAAPSLVLFGRGIIKNETIVCYEYPGFTMFSDPVRAAGHLVDLETRVIDDGKCITSVGPGSAMEFALAIVGCIMGEKKAEEIAQGMLIEYTRKPEIMNA